MLPLQWITAAFATLAGAELGQSLAGKLLAAILISTVAAFLTAPGRQKKRRIVAVAVLLALLDTLRRAAAALARDRRRKPPTPRIHSAWAPASWVAVGAAATLGFGIGGGGAAALGAWSNDQQQQQTNVPLLEIPDVHGRDSDIAAPRLADAGFRVITETVMSESVPRGKAVRTDPPGGSMAPARSRVTLIVSKGPRRVAVPDVTGLPRNKAEAILGDASLRVSATSKPSERVVKGDVAWTDPAAGARVARGSLVRLSISSGLATVAVPAVAGMAEREALDVLDRASLNGGVLKKPSESASKGTVIGTDPLAGERVAPGTYVTVIVSSGPALRKHAVESKNCGDFSTQEEAQQFFEEHGGPEHDPYGLDKDGDGIACESLHRGRTSEGPGSRASEGSGLRGPE